MRFFLVGRDRSTGAVRLIAESTYESRDEALEVLGDETASEEYAAYDLFVVDLDAVSPVVLYRKVVVAPAEPEPIEEPIADAWEAPLDEPSAPMGAEEATAEGEQEAESAEPVAAAEEPGVEEALAEAVAEEPVAEVETEEPVGEAETEEPVAEAETEEPAGEAEEPVAEAETEAQAPEPAGDLEWLPAAPEEPTAPYGEAESDSWTEPAAETEEDLASALRRAASTMEDSGVVAPPSVEEYALAGSEPGEADTGVAAGAVEVPGPDDAGMWPWEAEGGIASSEGETPEIAATEAPQAEWAAQGEPAPESQPEHTTDSLMAAIAAVAPGAWTDAEAAPEAPRALEIAADEAETAALAEETPPAELETPPAELVPDPATVAEKGFGTVSEDALLEYLSADDVPVPQEPAGVAEAVPDAGLVSAYVPVGIEEPGMVDVSLLTPAEPASSEPPGELGASEPATEPAPVEPPAGGVDLPDLSFAPGAPAADAKAYEPGESGIESYTCDDCVYVTTCTKHHQESPSTCGAFQWKPV